MGRAQRSCWPRDRRQCLRWQGQLANALAPLNVSPHEKTTGTDPAITAKWRPATRAVRAGTMRSEHGETSEALSSPAAISYDRQQPPSPRGSRARRPGCSIPGSRTRRSTMLPAAHRRDGRGRGVHGAGERHGGDDQRRCCACFSAGDHVVAGRAAFGSCRWILDNVLNRFGITHTAIDGTRQCRVGSGDPAQYQGVLLRNPGQSDDGHRRSGIRLRPGPVEGDHQHGRQCLCHRRCSSARWNTARMWSPIRPPS